jgi:ribosomal protein L3 glutamine methyltransferase
MARAFPNAKILATDISEKALEVAQINVDQFGLKKRIQLRKTDLFKDVHRHVHEYQHFDLIVSNPPYVATSDITSFPPEYKVFFQIDGIYSFIG